jgi:hypothetical protein
MSKELISEKKPARGKIYPFILTKGPYNRSVIIESSSRYEQSVNYFQKAEASAAIASARLEVDHDETDHDNADDDDQSVGIEHSVWDE